MESTKYSITATNLFGIIIVTSLISAVIAGSVGYLLAPTGGTNFDLPQISNFRVGFIPATPENVDSITTNARVLTDFLEKELNVPVEIYPVSNGYEELILAFASGVIDAAFLDGTPSHFVIEGGNAEIVLAEVRSANNLPYYNAAAWVRKDSTINSIATMLNGSFISAHTSATGTAGMVVPLGSLIKNGSILLQANDDTSSLLARYFKDSLIGGGYGGALLNVLEGNADVAFVRDSTPSDLYPERESEFRLLHVFGKVASHPIIVHTALADGWKYKFVQAMLKLNEGDNIKILQDLYGISALVSTNNQHIADISAAVSQLPWLKDSILSKES